MKFILLLLTCSLLLGCKGKTGDSKKPEMPYMAVPGVVKDYQDGKVYRTVTVGEQTWMAENINVGTFIRSKNSAAAHTEMKDNQVLEKYCYYNNEEACSYYGGLYTWEEAMQYDTSEGAQGICPAGWHMPSDAEWKKLEAYLGMPDDQVGSEGYRGTGQGWALQDTTRFAARMSGIRNVFGSFAMQGRYFSVWTSTRTPTGKARYRSVLRDNGTVLRDSCSINFGKCVRCIKD